MKLFEYAVIIHPSKQEKEAGTKSKLLVPPTHVLAHDLNAATVVASRAIPEENIADLDRIEVAVRPF